MVGNLIPLLTRDAFGPKAYTKIFSYMQIGIGLIGGFSNPIVSFFYTEFGTFNAPMVFAVVIAVVCIVFTFIAMAAKKGLQRKYWEGEKAIAE